MLWWWKCGTLIHFSKLSVEWLRSQSLGPVIYSLLVTVTPLDFGVNTGGFRLTYFWHSICWAKWRIWTNLALIHCWEEGKSWKSWSNCSDLHLSFKITQSLLTTGRYLRLLRLTSAAITTTFPLLIWSGSVADGCPYDQRQLGNWSEINLE